MTSFVPEGEAVGGGVEEPLAAKGGAPMDEQQDVDSSVASPSLNPDATPEPPAAAEEPVGEAPEVAGDTVEADAAPQAVDPEPTGAADEALVSAAEEQAGEPVIDEGPHRDVAMSLKETLRLLAERTDDLQRLQAEYVNYKRRVDRDRDQARQAGVESVVFDLMPVLDAIRLAGEHEELTGGFKAVADEVGRLAGKHGVAAYGEVGETFDPQLHEALMTAPGEPGQTEPKVAQVLQTGYRAGDRIIRYARVSVSEPGDAPAAE